jgi:hypothetical protein
MTPGQPPRQTRGNMSITTVQRWVLSVLATTTILHLSAGLAFAAAFLDGAGRQAGLLVISGAFGVIAFAAALVIHGKRLLNPLLALGLLPPLVGAYFIFVA